MRPAALALALAVALAVPACGSSDVGAADAAPPGTVDAAPPADARLDAAPPADAAPPDDRALIVGPPIEFPEALTGPRFSLQVMNLLWNGSQFVAQDDGQTFAAVDDAGAITAQRLSHPASPLAFGSPTACSASGPCALAWLTFDETFTTSFVHLAVSDLTDPTDAAVEPRPHVVEMFDINAQPQLGAHTGGFVVLTHDGLGLLAMRFGLDGAPIDPAPFRVFEPSPFDAGTTQMGCGPMRCVVGRVLCGDVTCDLELRRFHADGMLDTQLVPGVFGFTLLVSGDTVLVLDPAFGTSRVTLVAPDGAVIGPIDLPGTALVATPDAGFLVRDLAAPRTLRRLGLDGTLGPPFDLPPFSGSPGLLFACGQGGCRMTTNGSAGPPASVGFTVDGEVGELVPLRAPARQRMPRVATDGDRFLVEWTREGFDWNPNGPRDRRGAAWSPATGWATADSLSFGEVSPLWTDPLRRNMGWDGTRYIGLTTSGPRTQVAYRTGDGALLVQRLIDTQLDDVVCLGARCLGTGAGGWAVLDDHGAIVRQQGLAGGESRPAPMVFAVDGAPRFAFVRRDGASIAVAILAPDGLSETLLPIADGASVDPTAPIAAALAGDHLVIGWHNPSGSGLARAVRPDLSLSPVRLATLPGDPATLVAASLGGNVLFVGRDAATARYVGIRLDRELAPVGGAVTLSPPTVNLDTIPIITDELPFGGARGDLPPRLVSAGDHAVLAWTAFDPARGPQLALVPLALE